MNGYLVRVMLANEEKYRCPNFTTDGVTVELTDAQMYKTPYGEPWHWGSPETVVLHNVPLTITPHSWE